jgi:hypothetical protein
LVFPLLLVSLFRVPWYLKYYEPFTSQPVSVISKLKLGYSSFNRCLGFSDRASPHPFSCLGRIKFGRLNTRNDWFLMLWLTNS